MAITVSLAFSTSTVIPSGVCQNTFFRTKDTSRRQAPFFGRLALSGPLKDSDIGPALDCDTVGINDVDSDFLAGALRAKHQLIRANNANNKPTTTVAAIIAAKSFTSTTPNMCFLQFLLWLTIGTDLRFKLASALVLHPDGDQFSFSDLNHAR